MVWTSEDGEMNSCISRSLIRNDVRGCGVSSGVWGLRVSKFFDRINFECYWTLSGKLLDVEGKVYLIEIAAEP
jgi:hypothetical protein